MFIVWNYRYSQLTEVRLDDYGKKELFRLVPEGEVWKRRPLEGGEIRIGEVLEMVDLKEYQASIQNTAMERPTAM